MSPTLSLLGLRAKCGRDFLAKAASVWVACVLIHVRFIFSEKQK